MRSPRSHDACRRSGRTLGRRSSGRPTVGDGPLRPAWPRSVWRCTSAISATPWSGAGIGQVRLVSLPVPAMVPLSEPPRRPRSLCSSPGSNHNRLTTRSGMAPSAIAVFDVASANATLMNGFIRALQSVLPTEPVIRRQDGSGGQVRVTPTLVASQRYTPYNARLEPALEALGRARRARNKNR